MDEFIAIVKIFAGNFAPRGWMFCQGQILSIAQNTALFSLLGTTYGGNGQTTFALPDLRGRAPIGQGQGPGLSNYVLGQTGGLESATLTQANLPAHSHTVNAVDDDFTKATPTGALLANANIYTTAAASATMNPAMIAPAGQSQPFEIMPPYLAINYIICTEGIYPSRN